MLKIEESIVMCTANSYLHHATRILLYMSIQPPVNTNEGAKSGVGLNCKSLRDKYEYHYDIFISMLCVEMKACGLLAAITSSCVSSWPCCSSYHKSHKSCTKWAHTAFPAYGPNVMTMYFFWTHQLFTMTLKSQFILNNWQPPRSAKL